MKSWKSVLILSVFIGFLNALVFGGGSTDANGLKPKDYDNNGWAYKNGKWIPSPSGAVYENKTGELEVVSEEVIYHEITDVQGIETELAFVQNGLDINGLKKVIMM